MTRPLLALLILGTTLGGCNRLNPGTWLNSGGDTPAPTQTVVTEDPRPLIAQVTEVEVDRTPNGAIVRATGVAPTEGWYGPALIAQTAQPDGTLILKFHATAPATAMPTGTTTSRQIVAATALTNATLANTRRIVVQGASNALSQAR
ncbi:hypothetical protein [Falsirhodobacter halotolerans]|uniref:hypothetical protein n=1 Tax=Falsirhodobacter halotolerans TaxID=1146892 RepID=UPI001FD08823|nr:hypothetical protein [Falsirhodobacter halotolerans]MCJ8139386.1 hypothetical protein [Falsirhodobacter halotolerans]